MVPDEPPFEAILFLIDGSGSIKAPDFERVTLFFLFWNVPIQQSTKNVSF